MVEERVLWLWEISFVVEGTARADSTVENERPEQKLSN